MHSKCAALCLLLVGCGAPAPATDGTPVGLLLPYTGKDGSAGSNFERGALMAIRAVNDSGGVYHKRLRVVYADTRSTVEDGLDGADSLLQQGVTAIIGPENDDLAQRLAPLLASRGVPLITPSSSAPPIAEASETSLWFRLAPSAIDLGTSLARRIKAD
ncbi:MAG TPA: ABC transporter substrate-binding protein, partial [Polyangiaceae bacterium]|nr:ABC transporter substrate-binding protein [Polyangiaceae bacterium]